MKILIKCVVGYGIVLGSSNDSSINRINQSLKAFDNWSAKAIDKRQELLIKLANNVWKIEEIVVE